MLAKNHARDFPGVEKLHYNKREAAFALGVSVRTIDTMLAKKLLRRHLNGRNVLIPVTEVRRVAKQEQIQE